MCASCPRATFLSVVHSSGVCCVYTFATPLTFSRALRAMLARKLETVLSLNRSPTRLHQTPVVFCAVDGCCDPHGHIRMCSGLTLHTSMAPLCKQHTTQNSKQQAVQAAIRCAASLCGLGAARLCSRRPCCGCALVGARLQQDGAHDAQLAEAHAEVLAALDEAADLRPPVLLVPQRKQHHQPHPAPEARRPHAAVEGSHQMLAGTLLLLDGQHTATDRRGVQSSLVHCRDACRLSRSGSLPVVISQACIVDQVCHCLVRCIKAGLGAAAAYQVLLNLHITCGCLKHSRTRMA